MSERFEIGEVAIYVKPGSPNYGAEAVITGPLTTKWIITGPNSSHLGEAYDIDGNFVAPWPGATFTGWVAEPFWLRKKRLPPQREPVGEWDLCPWQPKRKIHEQA